MGISHDRVGDFEQGGATRGNVLVLADKAAHGRCFLNAIERCGAAATVVSKRQDACEQLTNGHSWTAFIVDVGPPDGLGLDVLKKARTDGVHCPALVITGLQENYIACDAFNLGAVNLVRPVEEVYVESIIHSAMDISADRRYLEDAVEMWRDRYRLSRAEASIVTMAAEGYSRQAIALIRRCTPLTLKAQIYSLIQKTGDDSFHSAVEGVLRLALSLKERPVKRPRLEVAPVSPPRLVTQARCFAPPSTKRS